MAEFPIVVAPGECKVISLDVTSETVRGILTGAVVDDASLLFIGTVSSVSEILLTEGSYTVSAPDNCLVVGVLERVVPCDTITGSGGGGPESDGTSDFYVDAAGDPIYVIKIYDEDTGVTTYTDTSGAPLVPGVDFFPRPDPAQQCCFRYEACADMGGEEVVVNVFELRDSALNIIARRLELADGTDVTVTATLVECGTCCGVEGCLTFRGFDYYALVEMDPTDSSTFEILVDNAIVATVVANYITLDTGNKSSWYADIVAAIAANTNWEMSVHTDVLSTDDGPKTTWNLVYSGPGDETLEIRYVTGAQSHIFNIDSDGVMSNSVLDQGTPLSDFGTLQFNEVSCNV